MKKFFIITSILFGFFLFFFLIYNFLFKNNPFEGKVPNVAVVANDTAPKIPDENGSNQVIAPFSEETATSPFFDKKSNALLFLVPSERALKERALLGNGERTVETFSFIPKSIAWSPDGRKALIQEGDIDWTLYDRTEKALTKLKSGIESPAWTSLGDRIFYKYYDPGTGKRTLTIANPDGTNWKVIGETDFHFLVTTPVPQSAQIAFWNRGNAFDRTMLKTIPAVGGEAKEVFSANYGADYLFAPNGQKILVSNVVEKGGSDISIATVNSSGGNYQNLFIPSFVFKAVWSKNSRFIYYSLPGSIPAGSILPNDYFQKPILTSDTFWKIDIETGEKSRIVDTNDIDQNYDATNLTLDADETMLFFVNRHDGKLYRIKL